MLAIPARKARHPGAVVISHGIRGYEIPPASG